MNPRNFLDMLIERYRDFDYIYKNSNEPEFSKANTNNNTEEEIIPGNEMIEFLSQFGVVK